MKPYVEALVGSRSTGPKVAIPEPSNGRSAARSSSQSRTIASVSRRVVVENSARSTMRSGSPSATATTHVVPPPSTPLAARPCCHLSDAWRRWTSRGTGKARAFDSKRDIVVTLALKRAPRLRPHDVRFDALKCHLTGADERSAPPHESPYDLIPADTFTPRRSKPRVVFFRLSAHLHDGDGDPRACDCLSARVSHGVAVASSAATTVIVPTIFPGVRHKNSRGARFEHPIRRVRPPPLVSPRAPPRDGEPADGAEHLRRLRQRRRRR